MARPCNVCSHPKVALINAKLTANEGSAASIARLFALGKDSILRHRAHISSEIKAAQTIKATGFYELTKAIERLTLRLDARLGSARRSASWFQESRELRSWISLRAKLAGKVIAETPKQARAGDMYCVQFRGPDGQPLRIPLNVYRQLPKELLDAIAQGDMAEKPESLPQGDNAVTETTVNA
jgi:hypothetical protein